jgi:hypothetical protein
MSHIIIVLCMLFIHFFVTSWRQGVRSPTVYRFIVPRVTEPNGLVSWCRVVYSPTVFHFIVPEVRSTRVLLHCA